MVEFDRYAQNTKRNFTSRADLEKCEVRISKTRCLGPADEW